MMTESGNARFATIRTRRKMNVVRRTCGYLGEKFWNVGKTKEIKARVTHL